ncbi:MAG: type II toxin-antitoxin system prevent-host-death family antitoxin [Propionibacteriaceae bacterium]|jgi:prevent-host-death family protein|nr:type II toxin-antitoxin system prevent-host-death family antitoxin [Propionibacteriaceae bacterium]
MTVTVGIQEAKAKLSELVDRALNGDEVIVTRRGEPVVRLERADHSGQRQFGLMPLNLTSDLLEPMTEAELRDWYGE